MKKHINITSQLSNEQLKKLKGGKNIWSQTFKTAPMGDGIQHCCNVSPTEPVQK